MKYTVKVNKVRKNEGNLRGFATVVFGESFKVTNIAILENSEGNLFVSMPRYRRSEVDEKNNYIYKDICNPITREFRTELYDAILDGYKNAGNENREVAKETNDLEMPTFAVAMPSYKTKQTDKEGKAVYQDICFPITKEFRERLYGEIVETYKEEKAKAVDGSHPIKEDEFMQVHDKEEGLPIR